ncbi:MAG: preprotein translocase subunit SecG [Janthinobacterium lividum]
MSVLRIVLQVLLAVSSLFLTLLILLHKGKGGGLSDMFGGGVTTSLSGSSMAQRNLNRFTVTIAVVWVVTIVLLGLVERFTNEF